MTYNIFLLMPSAAGNAESQSGGLQSFLPILLLVGMFALMYFFMVRPQKNQEKRDAQMREGTQIGDEIVTSGGILGRVVTIKEDSLVVETGADRVKIRITKTSILKNVTADQKLIESRQAALETVKANREAAKEKKSKKKNK
jgi:preprotein translocase subunit YajC